MQIRAALPLSVLAIVACGEPFTVGPADGGGLPGTDGSFDGGVVAPGDDAASPGDATVDDAQAPRDAMAKEGGGGGGHGDASTGGLDAGPKDAADVCTRTCPTGFDCLVDKCLDRAALRFSATSNNPLNWSYGYETSLGSSFVLYSSHWSPGSQIDVWTSTAAHTVEPSVFHNGGLSQQTYQEMTIPGAALGLYPGGNNEASILRWTAPAAGSYAIDVTFTGISAPITTIQTGVLVNNATGMGTSATLNEFQSGNTFTYSAAARAPDAGRSRRLLRVAELQHG